MIKDKLNEIKNKIFAAKRPPLEPVLNIYVYRDGVQVDIFSSADSQEGQRRNLSRLVSLFERYKTDIIHNHENGEIKIFIGKQKQDILYAPVGVDDKK